MDNDRLFEQLLTQRRVELLVPFINLVDFSSFFSSRVHLVERLVEEAPIDIFIFLLDNGLPVDLRLGGGLTPYLMACYLEKIDLIDLLFARGADANIVDDYGRTAAFCAVSTGEVQVFDRVILAGANLNTKTKEGYTLWYFARGTLMFQRLAEMKVPIEKGLILKAINDFLVYDIDYEKLRVKIAILKSVGCEEPTEEQLGMKYRRDYELNHKLIKKLLHS